MSRGTAGRVASGVFFIWGAASAAQADFSSCAVPWSRFSNPTGFTSEYTHKGQLVRDHETAADPSHGPATPPPAATDLASGSPGSFPGPYSTVGFGYYDGGTVWNADDPVTLEDDYILFRWRLQGNPLTNKDDFDSRHWNVLLDLDGDGYKEYWVDLNGAFQAAGTTDQLQILYDNQNRQDVPSPDAARVQEFSASGLPLTTPACTAIGSPGQSHTRVVAANDGTGDFFLEVQIPMTAFNDLSGNQVLFPDSPVAFAYTTSASNTDPLQKDHMMDLKFLSLADPIQFGDVVTPSGFPRIFFTDSDQSSVDTYNVGANIYVYLTDPRANTSSSTVECVNVTVTDPATGDDEVVRLCETGPASGIFTNKGGACAPTITNPSPAPTPPTAWLVGLATSNTTVDETWTLSYVSATDDWIVTGSVSGTQPTRAVHGVAYTTATGGLSFTLYQDAPSNGTVLSFCTRAADPLTSSTAVGADDNGDLRVSAGDRIHVAYTNTASITVSDDADILGPCTAVIAFTRVNGLAAEVFQLAPDPGVSDKLYVTVTHLGANTNPLTAQTITVSLTGYDSQTLTLTETGPNTGIFRNTTGLDTQISDGVVTASDGLWEDVDAGTITATYAFSCGGNSLSVSNTASVFAISGGGRVAFTNGAGTQDVTIYTANQPVFIKLTDTTVTCGGQVTVTVTSPTGDSETLQLFETFSGSGVYMNRINDLVTTAGSALVSSASSNFVALGIQPGDLFAIATGPDAGLYTVQSVVSPTQITLTTALTSTRTGIGFNSRPLMTSTAAGAPTTNNRLLEASHEDTLTVSYVDCSDGDGDPSNNTKTDTAVYNTPQILINAVLFAPDAATCQTEYVELFNAAGSPVVATGYRVVDEDSQLDYTVPQFQGAPLTLQPGQKIVISLGGATTDFVSGGTYYLFAPTSTYPSTLLGGPGDADPADQLTLYDSSSQAVDYQGWSATLSPSLDFLGDDSAAVLRSIWQDDAFSNVSAMTLGSVLERSADGFDTNKPSDWILTAPDTSVCDAIGAANRATLGGLRVGSGVEFATRMQRGTLGFNLYETDDPTGRVGLRLLNEELIPAPVPTSFNPILYRAAVTVGASYLVIEEVEVGGTRRRMGPFPVHDPQLESALEGIEARLSRGEIVEGFAPYRARRKVPRAGMTQRGSRRAEQGIKIEVAAAGIVRIALDELLALGLPPVAALQPRRLRLTNLAQPVPFEILAGREIRFRAESFETEFTDRNVYVLSWAGGSPAAPSVPFTRLESPLPAGWTRVEPELFYAPFVPEGADPWIWGLLFPGWPMDASFDIPLPGGSGPELVRLQIGLVSVTRHGHRVTASINGYTVGEVSFAGARTAVLEGTIPIRNLTSSGNRLTLEHSTESGDPNEWALAFCDRIDLQIPTPVSSGAASVARLAPYDAALPVLQGVDYLILTHSLFEEQARRVAALKAAEGLRPAVVDVENAYDRYASGVMEAEAIRAVIAAAARGGRLRYVLLVGDDTFDYKDHLGTGAQSFVPSLNGHDGMFGYVPSEVRYADVDGDGAPDVAIGRLPAQTPEEADVLVDKIARQRELLQAAGGHLFAVDNMGPGDAAFRRNAEEVAAQLGAADAQWVDVASGVDQARRDLLSGLRAGPLATHYFGHGGHETWADEALLSPSSAASLEDSGHATVLFTWACETQWYQYHLGPSISEALLLVRDGGALASLGPTGISQPRLQKPFYSRVYTHFFGGMSLGDAVRRAKTEAIREDPLVRPVVEGWTLLGDPALRLPERMP